MTPTGRGGHGPRRDSDDAFFHRVIVGQISRGQPEATLDMIGQSIERVMTSLGGLETWVRGATARADPRRLERQEFCLVEI